MSLAGGSKMFQADVHHLLILNIREVGGFVPEGTLNGGGNNRNERHGPSATGVGGFRVCP